MKKKFYLVALLLNSIFAVLLLMSAHQFEQNQIEKFAQVRAFMIHRLIYSTLLTHQYRLAILLKNQPNLIDEKHIHNEMTKNLLRRLSVTGLYKKEGDVLSPLFKTELSPDLPNLPSTERRRAFYFFKEKKTWQTMTQVNIPPKTTTEAPQKILSVAISPLYQVQQFAHYLNFKYAILEKTQDSTQVLAKSPNLSLVPEDIPREFSEPILHTEQNSMELKTNYTSLIFKNDQFQQAIYVETQQPSKMMTTSTLVLIALGLLLITSLSGMFIYFFMKD